MERRRVVGSHRLEKKKKIDRGGGKQTKNTRNCLERRKKGGRGVGRKEDTRIEQGGEGGGRAIIQTLYNHNLFKREEGGTHRKNQKVE